jgi:hypothetical protein
MLLTPLVVFFFVYLSKHFKKDKIEIYLVFAYLCFFELCHGFYLFSTIFLFALFYLFIRDRLIAVFQSTLCIISIEIVIAYAGLFLVNSFFIYVTQEPFMAFSAFYILYILVDIALANLLLRDY